jgi:3-dehydroquinate dehydratase type I
MNTLFFCSLTPELVAQDVFSSFMEEGFAWECRLDLLRELPSFLVRSNVPWMATYRTEAHGGQGSLADREGIGWIRRVEALEKGAQWLDLELDEMNLKEKMATGRDFGASIVLSGHFFEIREQWEELYRKAAEFRPDVIKLIGTGHHFSNFIEQKALYEMAAIPLVHFFMGEEFTSTRHLSCLYGAPLTFFCPRSVSAPAPGQLSEVDVLDLKEIREGEQTLLFGIAGFPVAHSRSPAFHGPRLKVKNTQTLYLRFPITGNDGLKMIWREFGRLRGLSVTSPLKEHAAGMLKNVPEWRAINTLVRSGDCFTGTNTDALAIRELLSDASIQDGTSKKTVRVLGYGGLGRTVVAVALEMGFQVQVCNRSSARLIHVSPEVDIVLWNQRHLNGCDVIVQCTTVGMGNKEDCPLEEIPEGTGLIIETIYHPVETRLLKMASQKGRIKTRNGREFFNVQAGFQNNVFLDALDY